MMIKKLTLFIFGGFLAGCGAMITNYNISASEMRTLIRTDAYISQANKIRQSKAWTSLSKIEPKTVRENWKELSQLITKIQPSQRMNSRSKSQLESYIYGYNEELVERVNLLISRKKYPLAKLAANALPQKNPTRKKAFEALAKQLELQGDKLKMKYPALRIYYLHAAAAMLRKDKPSEYKRLISKASAAARQFRNHQALPIRTQVSGDMSNLITKGLHAAVRHRPDAKLASNGVSLILNVGSAQTSRSQRQGSKSQKYASGTHSVQNPSYTSAQKIVAGAQRDVTHSRLMCSRHGLNNNFCKGLSSNRSILQRRQGYLSRTPPTIQQTTYKNYRYSTTTSSLRTSSQIQIRLQGRESRGMRRNQNLHATVSFTGHGSHSTIRLSARPLRPPSERSGKNALAKRIVRYASDTVITTHLNGLSQRSYHQIRRKQGKNGINECVKFLLKYPTANKRQIQAVWNRLIEISALEHRQLPR